MKRDYHDCSPQMYTDVFTSGNGPAVYDDLRARFYEIQSYAKGDPYQTAYNEGMRFVLGFIQNRIVQGEEEPQPSVGE